MEVSSLHQDLAVCHIPVDLVEGKASGEHRVADLGVEVLRACPDELYPEARRRYQRAPTKLQSSPPASRRAAQPVDDSTEREHGKSRDRHQIARAPGFVARP